MPGLKLIHVSKRGHWWRQKVWIDLYDVIVALASFWNSCFFRSNSMDVINSAHVIIRLKVLHPKCAGLSLQIWLPNFRKNQSLDIPFKASWNDVWYTNQILLTSTFFFWPYLLPWIPYIIWFFYKDLWSKHSFCHISQTLTDTITIFGRL